MTATSTSAARRRRAYTLIELLIVIAILGLAASVLVPSLVGRDSMAVQGAVRMIIADLSFAQSDALSHQGLRRLQFYDDLSGYCVVRVAEADFNDPFDPATADYVVDPLNGSNTYVVDLTDDRFAGVTITEVEIDGTGKFVSYDELGGTIMTGNAPGLGGQITVSSAQGEYRIDIAPFTGKLTVQRLN